jgi:hypothetical protein
MRLEQLQFHFHRRRSADAIAGAGSQSEQIHMFFQETEEPFEFRDRHVT